MKRLQLFPSLLFMTVWLLKAFLSPFFLSNVVTPYWKGSQSSVLSNDTFTSNPLPTARDIHPEDGNCNVCPNTGDIVGFYITYLKARAIYSTPAVKNLRIEQDSNIPNV
jgi:hypothetical protein